MSSPLHDDEPDTSRDVVGQLLRNQCPRWAELPLEPLNNTGADNVLHRLGPSLVVRLPRQPGAARSLEAEITWLPRLGSGLGVAVPELALIGESSADYPYPWAVLTWLDGVDAWRPREHLSWFGSALGRDLAQTVLELRAIPIRGAPRREPGSRGAPWRRSTTASGGGWTARTACSTWRPRHGLGAVPGG